jgi:transketolase
MLSRSDIVTLEKKANDIRISIIDMLADAGSGHTAGPLGLADIYAVLYFHAMKHRPYEPAWSGRDRLVVSNGHTCPVLYAAMAHSGYFAVAELATLRQFASRLQGHPHREFLPMLENSSGPLGSGMSQAVGMCLATRIDNRHGNIGSYVYCIVGDGELNEGNNWEAIMLAAKEKLSQLIVIVDRNNIQIDGNTEDIMPLENLAAKWKAFNWYTQEVDGHNMNEIHVAIHNAQSQYSQPSVIIAKTIPGKGVAEIERDYHWHGKPPTKEQEKSWLQKYFGKIIK